MEVWFFEIRRYWCWQNITDFWSPLSSSLRGTKPYRFVVINSDVISFSFFFYQKNQEIEEKKILYLSFFLFADWFCSASLRIFCISFRTNFHEKLRSPMAKQLPSNLAAVRGSSLWYWKIDGTANVVKRDLTLYKHFKTESERSGK